MTNKFFSTVLSFAFLLASFSFFGVANAQVASLPVGCTSTVGFSTTTGLPCNGTAVATTSFMAGCSSIFGFSTVNGLPCNGSTTASTVFFPGCTSILGFSTTTGMTCNGGTTAMARTTFFPGCTSTLGTSTFTGLPCSGGMTALPFLSGCTSVFGFSTITGQPCNGTSVASFEGGVPPIVTPGLPTTGAGGNAPYNLALLIGSGIVYMLGVTYLVRNRKTV